MTAARTPNHVPYDEFLRAEATSDQKHEWVDGAVYAMSDGSAEHARLIARVVGRVLTPLAEDGCESFSSEAALFIEALNQHTYADGYLVCGALVTRAVHARTQRKLGEAITNPCVIVEVLSDSTERYDRDGKFEAYKRLRSFEQYVLVSQSERRVEVRTREGERWTVQEAGAGETFRVRGRDFAVDDVYGPVARP